MKQAIEKSWTGIFLLGILAVIGVGSDTLASRPAIAAPRLLCGPTRIWDCTLQNWRHVSVTGTACEIQKYEKKHKATCQ